MCLFALSCSDASFAGKHVPVWFVDVLPRALILSICIVRLGRCCLAKRREWKSARHLCAENSYRICCCALVLPFATSVLS